LATNQRLTDKQELWISHYLGGASLNATEAARMAGYKDCDSAGFTNRKNPILRARIDEELRARAASSEVVLDAIAQLAFSPTITPQDRIKALELLGKAHGLFTDRLDLSGSLTSTVEIVGVDPGDV